MNHSIEPTRLVASHDVNGPVNIAPAKIWPFRALNGSLLARMVTDASSSLFE
jgi:hypothetical protein